MNTSSNSTEAADSIDERRRALFANGLRLSLGIALAKSTLARAAVCADPEELSGAQMSMRKSAEYTESFPDEQKTCRHCEFFKAGEGDCGICTAIGGPVSAGGHCTSWAARETKK